MNDMVSNPASDPNTADKRWVGGGSCGPELMLAGQSKPRTGNAGSRWIQLRGE